MNTHLYEYFNELWHRYNKLIYSYFRWQFDEATAEDLCQQTYLNAWKFISIYPQKEIKNGKSWLYSIAKNVRNDYLRYTSLYTMNSDYLNIYETTVSTEINFDDAVNMQKAFNRLSKEDKELLSMAEHLTSREIGSVLGISASATRSRIKKAKDNLKKLLNEYDLT